MNQPILRLQDVHVTFNPGHKAFVGLGKRSPSRLIAVDGVSLDVDRNSTLGIVGESGSGKSTLAKAIVRLAAMDTGSVLFEGRDLADLKGADRIDARRRIQLIFQDPYSALNPRLRVADAVTEPAVVHGLVARNARRSLSNELLARVGIDPALGQRRPHALSGGQRQRVAIARALAAQPDVLIADESVSALDVSIQAQILNLITEVQSDLGLAVVFISHQLSVIAHMADSVAVMYLGRVVEHGPTDDVLNRPSHPYTRALLQSQPGKHRRNLARAEPVLAGEVPSGLSIPDGCRFRTRCPIATEICATVDPAPTSIAPGHVTWCHHAGRLESSPV